MYTFREIDIVKAYQEKASRPQNIDQIQFAISDANSRQYVGHVAIIYDADVKQYRLHYSIPLSVEDDRQLGSTIIEFLKTKELDTTFTLDFDAQTFRSNFRTNSPDTMKNSIAALTEKGLMPGTNAIKTAARNIEASDFKFQPQLQFVISTLPKDVVAIPQPVQSTGMEQTVHSPLSKSMG